MDKGATGITNTASEYRSAKLSCLELYVWLARDLAERLHIDGDDSNNGVFVVTKDKDCHHLLCLRLPGLLAPSPEDQESEHSRTWQIIHALVSPSLLSRAESRQDEELFRTLGLQAVDWVWSGFSGLVLSLGSPGESAVGAFDLTSQMQPGLLGRCLEELCRRARADRDPGRFCLGLSIWELAGEFCRDVLAPIGEDASDVLRFETVRFETAGEALAVLEAAGLLRVEGVGVVANVEPRRCHTFLRVVVFDSKNASMAALHFAQVTCGLTEGTEDDRLLDADCQAVADLLEAASSGEPLDFQPGLSLAEDGRDRDVCMLEQVLAPLLTGNCKCFLLCSVPERPRSLDEASEAEALLDLGERASLINPLCTTVTDVRSEEFQLAPYLTVLRRLRIHECRPTLLADPARKVRSAGRTASWTSSPTVGAEVFPSNTNGVASHTSQEVAPHENASEDVALATPVVERVARLEAACAAIAMASSGLNKDGGATPAASARDAEPIHTADETIELAAARWRQNHGVVEKGGAAVEAAQAKLETKLAMEACLKECRELGAACEALRARNEAKALSRSRELHDTQADVKSLKEELESMEDACESRHLFKALRDDAVELCRKIADAREINAALAGARGEERRLAVRRTALHSLQEEVRDLQRSQHEAGQSEKRSNLVHKCLEEVQSKLEGARRRLTEVDKEHSSILQVHTELERKIEQIERQKRWKHDELAKLRRTSSGLLAELKHLQEVRAAVENLPSLHRAEAASKSGLDSESGRGGSMEHFAILQQRVSALGKDLVPLAARVASDMQALMLCNQRLEERLARLEKVAPVADLSERGGYLSVGGSSVASGQLGSAQTLPGSINAFPIARSSSSVAALALAGQRPQSAPVVSPAGRVRTPRASSAQSTQGSATPRQRPPSLGTRHNLGSSSAIATSATGRQPQGDEPIPALRSFAARIHLSDPLLSEGCRGGSAHVGGAVTSGQATPRRNASSPRIRDATAGTYCEVSSSERQTLGGVTPRRGLLSSYASAMRPVAGHQKSCLANRCLSEEVTPRSARSARSIISLDGAASSVNTGRGVWGAPGALNDLGLRVPLGNAFYVAGVQLSREQPPRLPRSKSQDKGPSPIGPGDPVESKVPCPRSSSRTRMHSRVR